ncbi:MAG: CDP-alcohol phosphatidyltransferase [Pseudomonadales bacterium]|nr:CDP-alcohol phosphatidyltransferase [Pseudomonadales bacterium]RLU02060.1 MAG: CDP-alcohol phosphatidyltransferase family protein [Ketobacter sp.]
MNAAIRNIPNALTVLRIVLVFPFVWYMVNGEHDRALWTLLVAGATDSADGFLARKFQWRSQFGSIADPVADKVLMVTAYLTLAITGHMPWWVAAVVVCRDVYIFTGAIAYWFVVGRYEGSPTLLSKACTFFMITLGLVVLANLVWPLLEPDWIQAFSALVVVLCIFSMGQYTVQGIQGYSRKVRGKVGG